MSFKDFLLETGGNPLSRMHKHFEDGRHISIISAQRDGLSKSENESRHKELRKKLTDMGYGHREVVGHWDGNKEKSVMVFAKGTGEKAGHSLRTDVNSLGRHYDQDSVFHHDGKKGSLHGTNKTGWVGDGKDIGLGKIRYNRAEAPYQTETKPGSKRKSARFSSDME